LWVMKPKRVFLAWNQDDLGRTSRIHYDGSMVGTSLEERSQHDD